MPALTVHVGTGMNECRVLSLNVQQES